MAHYNWDQQLDTGIDSFDLHHQRIMEYANEIFNAVKFNDREKVGYTLDLLLEYTVSVFSYEDNLMDQSGYPYAAEHKAVHRTFTHKIARYRQRHQTGEDVSRQLLSELKVWITNHVRRDDRDYVPYVRKKFSTNWFSRFFGKKCA
ncbi:MAG: bacteriohemerythrin [Chromatiales bacterium]|nr:bacteriohemerythrin [Chromatiales bacterium]